MINKFLLGRVLSLKGRSLGGAQGAGFLTMGINRGWEVRVQHSGSEKFVLECAACSMLVIKFSEPQFSCLCHAYKIIYSILLQREALVVVVPKQEQNVF
jgi:hypothetical protein